MAIRLSVDQMIATFGSTYRTIDLRSAVVKQGSVWTNIYTVIRFTYEEPEVAKRRLLDLEAKHGVIATKSFQVRLESLPFSQWSALCQGLSTKGRIGEIAFSPNIWINLTRTLAFLRNDYSAVRPFDSREWPVAQFSVNTYGVAALATDTLVGETTRIRLPGPVRCGEPTLRTERSVQPISRLRALLVPTSLRHGLWTSHLDETQANLR